MPKPPLTYPSLQVILPVSYDDHRGRLLSRHLNVTRIPRPRELLYLDSPPFHPTGKTPSLLVSPKSTFPKPSDVQSLRDLVYKAFHTCEVILPSHDSSNVFDSLILAFLRRGSVNYEKGFGVFEIGHWRYLIRGWQG